MKIYYFASDRNNVTTFYLELIVDALNKIGVNTILLKDLSISPLLKLSKDSWFLTTGHKDVTKLYYLGFRNFINWFQGLPAEEDFLHTHSRLRYAGMNFLDKTTFFHSSFGFYVSQYQLDYLCKKYHFVPKQTFIMPCFNEMLNPSHFKVPGKYEKHTFCYIGSIGAWQRFEDVVSIYEQIEKTHPNCFLKILTQYTDEAKDILSRHSLQNYSIGSVAREQVANEISDCKFGFIIRDNIIINNVATPTKLSNYLASGVMPIFSDSLHSYVELAEKYPYLYMVSENDVIKKIEAAMNNDIKADDVLATYQKIFNNYFNRNAYLEQIMHKLSQFLLGKNDL